MYQKLLPLLTLVLLVACASRASNSTVILDYADFGPQAMAYNLIGPKELSWDPTMPLMIGEGHIKVVVYRGIGLNEVKQAYPVDPIEKVDYRYVSYRDALLYLDQRIDQNLLELVTRRLIDSRQRIQRTLGKA